MKSIEKIKNKTRRMAVHRLVRAFLGCGGNQPWKRVEAALLVAGLTLAGFYFAGRLESYLESRAALKEFQSRDAQAFPRPLPPIENRAPTNGEASGADPDKNLSGNRRLSAELRLGVLEDPEHSSAGAAHRWCRSGQSEPRCWPHHRHRASRRERQHRHRGPSRQLLQGD